MTTKRKIILHIYYIFSTLLMSFTISEVSGYHFYNCQWWIIIAIMFNFGFSYGHYIYKYK